MPQAPLLDVTIASIGARGDGLATTDDGQRLFVPFAVPGDRLRVRVVPDKAADGLRGEIVDIVEPGPDRAEPACPHYGQCGGCTLQHLTDDAYATTKLAAIRTALGRVGLDGVPFAPLARTAPAQRRRARFAALRKGGKVRLGFNERLSHRLVEITACPVLHPDLLALIGPLRTVLGTVLPEGGKADVMVARLDGGIDVLLIGPTRLSRDARERLTRFAESANLGRLSWRADDRGGIEPLAHRLPLVAHFDGVNVTPPPGAFLQASAAGEAALVEAVSTAVAGAGRVADLFAGLGTFSLPLARESAVAAFEGDAAVVEALNRCGHGRRLTATRRDLFETPLTAKELSRFDAVVFDPPRAGAAAQAATLATSKVPVIVGVSCNPATFARDARTLADGGYDLQRVSPVDQFLWSAHVELVGVFRLTLSTPR